MVSKMFTAALAFACLACSAPTASCDYITAAEADAVKKAFLSSKIIPGVVPDFTPTVRVDAEHGTNKVSLGNSINTLETLTEPTYTFTAERDHDASTTKYFKFILDPDAPGPDGTLQNPLTAVLSNFLHLAVQNASPDCVADTSEVVRLYLSPTPLSVANHRYIFLVYRQPPNFQAPLSLSLTFAGLKLQDFVNQYGLELVGGNYYVQGLGTDLGGIGSNGPL